MALNDEVVETIKNQMKTMIAAFLDSATFDRTEQGLVTTVLDDNKYSVSIKGTVYTVPSATSDTYSVNDKVSVTYYKNNSKRKYITGKEVS